MESQANSTFEGVESTVIPFLGQPTDMSSASPLDAATDERWTDDGQGSGQNRTFTFKQASKILECNESTLRRRYWQEKVEPAFKHCPTPLRTITRYNRDNHPVFEFSKFGLEVLKAFLVAKSEGREDKFLIEARLRYPTPIESISQKQDNVSLSPIEVLPRENDQTPNSNTCGNGNATHPSRMVLHIGSSLSLPEVPSVVTPGNDAAYLTQAQQRLQQFEAMQQQVLAQMEQQQKEAEDLNTQYQEATSLSDQLLLQEFQLKGVQLGYTALQLKQQAFKSTVQAAEAGTLPVPGKPQSESGQPQSA